MINLATALFLFCALQGLFLTGVLLLQQRGNSGANRLLAGLLFVFSLIMLENALASGGYYAHFTYAIFATTSLWFLIPPLLYFYICRLDDYSYRIKVGHLLHLLPFAIELFRIVPFYLLPEEIKLAVANGIGGMEVSSEAIAFVFQGTIYFLAGYRKLRSGVAGNNHNSDNAFTAAWLRFLIILLVIYVILDFLAALFLALNGRPGVEFTHVSLVTFALLVHAVAYSAIVKPEQIFPTAFVDKIKYRTSPLSSDDLNDGAQKIIKIMEQKKPYLENEFALKDLAGICHIEEHHLSQILSQYLKTGFYDFVNGYRVKEAQQQLRDPAKAHITILGIGMDVGFNSKASFYRAFRRFTNMTPTEYRGNGNSENRDRGVS